MRYVDLDGAGCGCEALCELSGEGRSANWAMEFMLDCAARIKGRVQVTTDGHKVYPEAVETAFGATCDYAMLQKIYGAPAENDTRYSPATCIGCDMKVVSGDPDTKHVSTSYVERHNLSMRMGMRRFTRQPSAASTRNETHLTKAYNPAVGIGGTHA